jgi:hypothetical protein
LQRGQNQSEKSNRCLQILIPSQKTPSSINFLIENLCKQNYACLG